MKLSLARAMGTCFGVQEAIDAALSEEFRGRLTIIGQLVHNPQVIKRLQANGIAMVERDALDQIHTPAVMISAHGTSNAMRNALKERGLTVYDATCPLVLRLHKLALSLERKDYFPVIIGRSDHVEVQGVVGNLRRSAVVAGPEDFHLLEGEKRIGVVSQTTNALHRVQDLLAKIEALPWVEELRFMDTICQPVKDRQQAVADLIAMGIDLGIVIGGKNSANTHKLSLLIAAAGIESQHIEGPEDIDPGWLQGKQHVGVTAGTSTPAETVDAVCDHLRGLIAEIEGDTPSNE